MSPALVLSFGANSFNSWTLNADSPSVLFRIGNRKSDPWDFSFALVLCKVGGPTSTEVCKGRGPIFLPPTSRRGWMAIYQCIDESRGLVGAIINLSWTRDRNLSALKRCPKIPAAWLGSSESRGRCWSHGLSASDSSYSCIRCYADMALANRDGYWFYSFVWNKQPQCHCLFLPSSVWVRSGPFRVILRLNSPG